MCLISRGASQCAVVSLAVGAPAARPPGAPSGGVVVDENLQCLTPEGAPIEGLYAIGNVAGGFYGGVDYPLTVFGLNLGHNYTQGYVVGKALAAK